MQEPVSRRIARNTAIRVVAQASVKVLAVVLFAVLARTLGLVAVGQLAFALAVVQLVAPIAAMGIDRMSVRDMARDPGSIDRLWFDVLVLKAATTGVALGAAVGVVAATGRDGTTVALVALLATTMVTGVAIFSADAVFQAMERAELLALVTVPGGILNTAVALAILAAGGDILAVGIGMAVTGLLYAALAVAAVRRFAGRPAFRVRPRGWPRLARRSAAFGVQEVFGQLIFRFDTVLLGLVGTAVAVGEYGAAFRLLEATLFVAWALGTAVLPSYSTFPQRDGEDGAELSLHRVYAGSVKGLLVLMLPMAVAFGVCAPAVLDLFYGDGFEGAAPLLRLLSAAIVLYGIGHLAGLLVLVRRGGRVTVRYMGAVAVSHLALCAILIPLYGATGAAVATLATEAVLAVSAVVLARRVGGWPHPVRDLLPPLLAGGIMAAVMVPVADRLWFALPLGAAAFVVVLGLLEGRRTGANLRLIRALGAQRRAA